MTEPTNNALLPNAKPDDPRELALARLAASRLRLRQQMIPQRHPNPATPNIGVFQLPRRLRALWRGVRRQLRGSPVALMALSSVQNWWQRHPWRITGELVARELHGVLTPTVRRHPVAAALLAGGLGIALMRCRPWRWSLVANQLRPMPSRVGHWLLHQLTQAPGQALLSSLLLWLSASADTRNRPEPTAPPQDPA
jgi:hypothetical protein